MNHNGTGVGVLGESHIRIRPSTPPLTMRSPVSSKREIKPKRSASIHSVNGQAVLASQRRDLSAGQEVNNRRPSALKQIWNKARSCINGFVNGSPVAASQTRAVQSREAAPTRRPS